MCALCEKQYHTIVRRVSEMNRCNHDEGHKWSDKGEAYFCKKGCGHSMNFNPHHAGEFKQFDWYDHVLSFPRVTPIQRKEIELKPSKY